VVFCFREREVEIGNEVDSVAVDGDALFESGRRSTPHWRHITFSGSPWLGHFVAPDSIIEERERGLVELGRKVEVPKQQQNTPPKRVARHGY
jgi:hypothetical protein